MPLLQPFYRVILTALETSLCAWASFHAWYSSNQFLFGFNVTVCHNPLSEGTPRCFWCHFKYQMPHGSAGMLKICRLVLHVDREGSRAQDWNELSDFGYHPDTRGLNESQILRAPLKGSVTLLICSQLDWEGDF